MQNEAQARALDVCIQHIQNGEKLEQILELYPQWTAELTPPLESVQVLRVYVESFPPDPTAIAQNRNNFLYNAQQIHQKSGTSGSQRTWGQWLAWLGIILAVLLATSWGLSVASRSLPGELSSSIKGWWQQTRLAITTDAGKRLALERAYDQSRLDDARALFENNQTGSISFPGLLVQGQTDAWMIGGIPVRTSPQTQIIGNVQDGIWVEVAGELLPGQVIQASQIRPREYRFTGALEEIAADSLVVSGIPIQVNGETLVHGSPMAGSEVKVIMFRTAGDYWLARLVDSSEQ